MIFDSQGALLYMTFGRHELHEPSFQSNCQKKNTVETMYGANTSANNYTTHWMHSCLAGVIYMEFANASLT